MSSEWDKGVMAVWAGSSWHGLEQLVDMPDAQSMIREGERSGAWPTSLVEESLITKTGLPCDLRAIVGVYENHAPRVLGAVGDRYRATACEEWRGLVRAAALAGARPTGAFSLSGGSQVLATFEVGETNGLITQFLLVDTFDGRRKLTCGSTTIRVVCANTLRTSLFQDGEGMAALRHTKSLEERVKVLQEQIPLAIASGENTRDLYKKAGQIRVSKEVASKAFDALFPEAPKDAAERTKTVANKAREEARAAAQLPQNKVGDQPRNLATLYNAATWLVDRDASGAARKCRGDADRLESLLFGSRAQRVQEIVEVMETTIEVVMRDGTYREVKASEAIDMGIDPRDVGRKVLEDMTSE